MKGMKKLLSILMVLTLVLSLGASAFAATVEIDSRLASHTFTAYQIFTGVEDPEKDNSLGDIGWGNGINAEAFVEALKGLDDSFADLTADDAGKVAEAIGKAATDNSDLAKAIAEAAVDCITGSGTPVSAPSTELPAGYYLIKDTTPKDELNGNAAYNDVVLQVTGKVKVDYKTDIPTSDKNVKDKTDIDGNETDWQKSADWDIGDDVPFQFTATLPNNYGDYDKYAITFHDVQSDGLTFDADSVKVFVDGTQVADGYTVVTEGLTDGCTFEIVITDLKAVKDASGNVISTSASSKIEVTYESELNKDCIIGIEGNPNTMLMEFSNNPHGEGTGKTPEKTVIVFTFDLDVNKVDGENQPLTGAEFALYKEVPAGTEGAFQLTEKGEKVTSDNADEPKLNDGAWYIDNPNELKGVTDDLTTFTAEGLDDGNYVIVETKTPDGYNTADPIEFTIEANHVTTSGDKMTSDQLTITGISKKADASGAETDVVNQHGPTLPETGGIGTTIFYIVGAVLVAGAVILLVTKKRVSGMEK